MNTETEIKIENHECEICHAILEEFERNICDERLQAEDAKVLEVLKEEFPAAEDWNVNDNEEAEILDKDGNIICKISTDRLTKIYNSIEA